MATQFGKYQLLKKIAAGGMAEIHLAKQRGMEGFEKIVVIKMILPHLANNEEFVQMFLDEARLAAKLTHPNIVQIFDLGRAAGTFFIAMEYIQGENLRVISKNCRNRKVSLPQEHVVKIISQACEGLYHAHTKTDTMGTPLNVVHRDISPQNILVSFEGMTKVVDFGIAKAATQYQETRSGVLKGKYAYMSPEQCTGRPVDARSDIFALGIVLWELATGTRLFKKSSELMILKEITEGVVTPPRQVNQQIPAELEAIILKSLEKDPANRFQDALQMHLAMEEYLKNQGMISSTVHLAAFMRKLFKHKLDNLRKIEQAQNSGDSLESLLFNDVEGGAGSGTDAQTPSQPSNSGISPVNESARPLFPRPTTGVSRVTGLGADPNQQAGTAMATQATSTALPLPQESKRNPLLYVVLVVLVLILGGLGYMIWSQMQTDPDPRPDKADAGSVIAAVDRGTISVSSRPEGGTVKVDGNPRCTAPCEVNNLQLGTYYNLEVSKPGHKTWTSDFKLDSTEVRTFSALLKSVDAAGWGWVEVSTDPRGASLILDGQRLTAKTPTTISQVKADQKHSLRASVPGRKDWVKTFNLRPNQRLKLTGKLVKGRGPPGKKPAVYTLKSRPGGAKFFLNGAPIGSSVKLEPGRSYRLTARLSGHHEWGETVNPNSGERKKITARLRRKGGTRTVDTKARLSIDANPWANVFVDGKKIGTTPVNNHLISAGPHKIKLTNPELNAKKILNINAKPGEKIRRKVSFAVATGKLSVSAKPWAHVYVTGKKIGTTPIPPKALPEGTYTIRLVNPTLGEDVTKQVIIRAGQTARVNVDFLN
jgi:serine/threonine protein kinase